MAEPALVLSPTTRAVAVRDNSGARRTITPARLRCRADVVPEQVDAAPPTKGEADDATDYTGFSMVGVAG